MYHKYRKITDRLSVNVTAALTLMVPATDLQGHQVICVEITNPSGVDTIDAQLEFATSAAGPWCIVPSDAWKTILPGATRNETYDKLARNFARVRGQSLGATINGVIVSLHAESV